MKKVFFILLLLIVSILGNSQNTITISSITITGNKITKEDIILREIAFSKNSSFATTDLEQKIKESKRNIVNLKLFNFVKIGHVLEENQAKIFILTHKAAYEHLTQIKLTKTILSEALAKNFTNIIQSNGLISFPFPDKSLIKQKNNAEEVFLTAFEVWNRTLNPNLKSKKSNAESAVKIRSSIYE